MTNFDGLQRQNLVILGAGRFAEEVADLVSDAKEYELVGFVEGVNREQCNTRLLGLPILWIDEVAHLASSCQAVCAVGSTRRRGFIQRACALGLSFATLVHPAARVSSTASLGRGTIVSAGSVIAAHTRIGCHVIVNRGCLIGHHAEIADYATISPGANLGGRVRIGEGTYIAMGAILLDRIQIGSAAVVAAGAVVTRDVPDRVQVMGVPARITKEEIEAL